jgi:hypothetical protein
MSTDLPNNLYQSPAAVPLGEQVSSNAGHSERLGGGYFAILFLNIAWLLGGAFVLCLGFNEDGYASLATVLFGMPLFVLQLLLGCLPAFVYLGRKRLLIGRTASRVLIAISMLAPALTAGGLVATSLIQHRGTC